MVGLIAAVIFGLIIAFLAIQNPTQITVQMWQFRFENVPLYVIIFFSLLAGLLISGFIGFVNFLSSTITIQGKQNAIQQQQQEIQNLREKVKDLERENISLKQEREDRRGYEENGKLVEVNEKVRGFFGRFRS